MNAAISMTRRAFLRGAAGLLACAGGAGLAAASTASAGRRPHLLFILADDHAFNAVGALGNKEVRTPNLDRLVHRGVSFLNAYNQGGWHGAVCVASRTMLLTGRYLWRAAALDSKIKEECAADRLWPQCLEQAGYHTRMSGKWHVNCRAEAAFQQTRHVRPGMPPDVPEQYHRPRENETDAFDPSDPRLGGFWTGGAHWSNVVGDDGVHFIQEAAAGADPYFIYLAFNAPHDPRQSPKEYVDAYRLEDLEVPKNFLPENPDKNAMGCGEHLRDEKLAPFPRTAHAALVHRREYYAAISHMDAQIGRLLDELDASGLSDNTYVVFMADQGLAVGSHGLMGKQNMYEHSMKAPLIIAGPGLQAGQRIAAPVYLQDIMPTALDWAGVPTPDYVDFESLTPFLRGEERREPRALYGAYMDKQRMIRVDRHKLIYYPLLEKCLLFDLEDDPLECSNLAESPEYAPLLETLQEQLGVLQQEMDDPLAPPRPL